MSHQWTMEDFESIYSRFKSSGLSVMDFCSNECIRPKRFYEWRSKLLRKGGFIPVKVNSKGQVSLPHKEKSLLSAPPVSPSPIPQPLCEISYPNGKVKDNVNKYLKKLTEQWEELPPHFVSSSEKKTGRQEILDYIDSINQSLKA